MNSPTAKQLRKFRKQYGLSQAKAGELIYIKERQWRYYESGECTMHPAYWELAQLKAKSVTDES